jgi:hypothetical protein
MRKLTIAAVTFVIVATTITATAAADVGDANWFEHGGAIAASNYVRKQLGIKTIWYDWKAKCEVNEKGRAKCWVEYKLGPQCSGTFRAREKRFHGGIAPYNRRISCGEKD